MKFGLRLFSLVGVLTLIWFSNGSHAKDSIYWQTVCNEQKEDCRITQELMLQTNSKAEEGNTKQHRILTLHVLKRPTKESQSLNSHLTIQLPLGVDLPAGLVFKVDKGPETNLPFLRCTRSGCDASLKLTDQQIQTFKKGQSLFVGFRAWGSKEATVLEASLIGFTKAYSNL